MTEDTMEKNCPDCMKSMPVDFRFCGQCGASLVGSSAGSKHWLLRLLNAEGEVEASVAVMPGAQVIGSGAEADIRLEGDKAVSPRHVLMRLQNADLSLEDQGSRNGLFQPLAKATPIAHNDLIRAGGQLFRFQLLKRLGVDPVLPLPHPAFGPSKPAWARLLRYNRHGQVSMARLLDSDSFSVGRRDADWTLKRTRTMSGTHFLISRDEEGFVSLCDLQSRNGTFVEVRGAVTVTDKDTFLIGDRSVMVAQVPLSEYHKAIGVAEDMEIQEAQAVDASELSSEVTYEAIPEDIIEAALEDSIPPVLSEPKPEPKPEPESEPESEPKPEPESEPKPEPADDWADDSMHPTELDEEPADDWASAAAADFDLDDNKEA